VKIPEFSQDEIAKKELMLTYLPIVRGTGAVAFCYFLFNSFKRYYFSSGTDMVILIGLSLVLGSIAATIWWISKHVETSGQLEAFSLVLSSLFLVNSNVHLMLNYEQENLAYFILLMPIFACINPTLRALTISVLTSFASLMYFLTLNQPELIIGYVSVSIAGLVAAIGVSILVRGSVINAVRARLDAVRDHERAVSLSVRDTLTDLPNRRSFFSDFDERLKGLRQKRKGFVLVLIDLDGFKPVNDTYGHATGDQLLVEVGLRLKNAAPENAKVARLGGDEFAVLADLPGGETSIFDIGDKISSALKLPYNLDKGMIGLTGSVGLLRCDNPMLEQHEMMERADHALYVSKEDRHGEPVVFSKRHEKNLLSVSKIDKSLRKADLKSELSLHLQPQYNLQDKRVYGFEALARWNSPELGLITPDLFIPIAERSCQMRDITEVLLSKALKTISELPDDISLSFNLSAHDLMSPAAIENVLAMIKESNIKPNRLEFEITETAMMVDFETACRSIDQLSRAGCSLSLDDFGVGHSNFSYLQRLAVNKIKIDRSFVGPLLDDPTAAKIIRTLINLSRSLDMECVVEGVETPCQLEVLEEFGARYIQGYLFAKPMPIESVPDYLDAVERGEADNYVFEPSLSIAKAG